MPAPTKVDLKEKLQKERPQLFSEKELAMLRDYRGNKELIKDSNDDILKRAGLKQRFEKGKNIEERTDRLKNETKDYDQDRVFHITQIRGLLKKYHLRFLPTQYFKGEINEEAVERMKNFEAAYGVTLEGKDAWVNNGLVRERKRHAKDTNLFIVAPSSTFKLETAPPKDPLLFYKINSEYYYLIHKWGNDLSVFRRVLSYFGSPSKTFWNLMLLCWTITSIVMYNMFPESKVEGVPFWLGCMMMAGFSCFGYAVLYGLFNLIVNGDKSISLAKPISDHESVEQSYSEGNTKYLFD